MTDEPWTAKRVVRVVEKHLDGEPIGGLLHGPCEIGSEARCFQLIVREIQGDTVREFRVFKAEG